MLINRSNYRNCTRDKHILKEYEADIIPKLLKYTQGLPLAISVMGSLLYQRDSTQWRATLEGLENNPDSGIMKVLKSNFEGLQPREREIFLHIACFFDGEREDYVRRILDACELQPDIGISLIAEKSFITIRNQEIHMHKMFQELGKQIVRQQHPDEPRLWLYRDFYHAMITKSEAVKAKAVILNQKEDISKFNQLRAQDLSKMENLEVLILYHTNFSGSPIFLSNSLRYVLWKGYPFMSLPSDFQTYRLVELNMPDSSFEQLWIGIQNLPNLKRMDLSNSKNLKMTPSFKRILNLERLDLTNCINLLHVDPSIGLLTELVFLSLQNCSSLGSLDFGNASQLRSLKILCLSDCKKLKSTPNFSGLSFLQYLNMDRCASLFAINQSIGDLVKLRFLSLRLCMNLVQIPVMFNKMRSLETLDLLGCTKLNNLPLRCISPSPLQSLIYLDLSFCKISEVSDTIGELRCLERLNLQGNNFTSLPSSLSRLHNLSYLNLSHCHKLQSFPSLPTTNLMEIVFQTTSESRNHGSDSVGKYFKTTSESRNHRSGLYIFDSPNCKVVPEYYLHCQTLLEWLARLVQEPRHFRCGFDIVLPWHGETTNSFGESTISELFKKRFIGGSIVRIEHLDMHMHIDWGGYLFYVTFELNNSNNHHVPSSSSSHQSRSSSPLRHPFYLSFESEHIEECFDMPLSLERNTIDGKHYIWIIFISREHCHFVKTGAQITFKARQGLIMKEWGLRVVTKRDREGPKMRLKICYPLQTIINAAATSINFNFITIG